MGMIKFYLWKNKIKKMKKWLFLVLIISISACSSEEKAVEEETSSESQETKKMKSDNVDHIYAVFFTEKGEIVCDLTFEHTPVTVANFIALALGEMQTPYNEERQPYFDNLTFHRVIDEFMIQGGDPLGTGTGGPGYSFPDEFTNLKHDRPGTLSMANSGPNTNGSQFFITHVPTPWLDGKHTVFGYVIQGQDVVDRIEKGDRILHVEIQREGDLANDFHALKTFERSQER